MPTKTRISPELLAEVKRRRTAGERWKVIERMVEQAGCPMRRCRLWGLLKQGVYKHPEACAQAETETTPPA
jgi:hypothetical protein